jgi:sialic acid synthase
LTVLPISAPCGLRQASHCRKNDMSVKIVAELGCNHQGSYDIAVQMIHAAKMCGCDYVKLQKRHLGCIPAERAAQPYENVNSFGKTYLDHRTALEFDGLEWRALQHEAEKVGIGFFATAFDIPSIEFLCAINVPFLKIGSGQIRDKLFLKEISESYNAPPLIVSTGMCSEDEVQDIVNSIPVTILVHTTSAYPCPDDEINLHWITFGMKKYMQVCTYSVVNGVKEIGLSGHYVAGNGAIEAAAVALGATYIERHFTLDRTWKGTDHAASLEPIGMMNVVKAVRQVERALGNGIKKIMPSEIPLLKKYR